MKRTLITGAGGFIGRHLTGLLRREGLACTTAGTRAGGPDHVQFAPDASAEWTRLLGQVQPDAIFHLAGTTDATDRSQLFRINCAWPANLLAAASQTGFRVILVGSAAEYGRISSADLPLHEESPAQPRSLYGISKYTQTLLAQSAASQGANVVVARLFNVIGAGMREHLFLGRMAADLRKLSREPKPGMLKVGNLASSRDFISGRQAAEGLVALARAPEARGQVVSLCSGVPLPMSQLLDWLLTAAGMAPELVVDPTRLNREDPPVVIGSQARFTALTGHRLPPITATDVAEVWTAGPV